FERHRLMVAQEPYLLIRGKVQKSQGTLHIIARRIEALRLADAPKSASHDFH
ncbi:MAG: hypothetical protein GVY36_13265, partial [Verrucomicrobia bacterium]|nr:hypothetical protein [Verrucomicrobiota bacterium]